LGELALTYINNKYQIQIDTASLAIGSYSISVSASSTNYTQQSAVITLTILQLDSNLVLLLNDQDKTLARTLDIQCGQILNISIAYFDAITLSTILSADVDVTNSLIGTVNIALSNSLYQIMINCATWSAGLYSFTISAQNVNYTVQSILFTLSITPRIADLSLFLQNVNSTLLPTIEVEIQDMVNITVIYANSLTHLNIVEATVILTGFNSTSYALSYGLDQYQILVSTNSIQVGIYYLRITASASGYVEKSILLTIKVNVRSSSINLFFQAQNVTQTRVAEIEINQFAKISVQYMDYWSSATILSASVIVSGSTIASLIVLTLQNGFYTGMLDSSQLVVGFHMISITATASQYKSQSILLSLKVTPVNTGLNIYLQDTNVTLTPVLEVPLRTIINFTAEYFTSNSLQYIHDANLMLSASGISSISLNETSSQYFGQLNASSLGLGIHFITIYANKNNFAQNSLLLTITVIQIPTNISTMQGLNAINVVLGDPIQLDIIIENLVTHELIRGVTVSYTYDFGKGTLIETNNDGHYKATFTFNKVGIYVVYITAYKGIEYKFELYQLTINVVAPTIEGGIPTYIVASLIVGLVSTIAASLAYMFYFRFPKEIRRIHKIKRNLGRKTPTDVKINSQDTVVKEKYTNLIKKDLSIAARSPQSPKSNTPSSSVNSNPAKNNNP
jgi:hypothetical protein